ncbi:MAG: hypothetical protein AB7P49_15220 [Bdellovibrionales bacterium]
MDDWRQLPDRQRAIIDFVARYRLATDDILHKLFFHGIQSVSTVQKFGSRMSVEGWLDKFQAIPRRNVYVLGRKFNQPRSRQGTTAFFSEQSLPEAIAIMYFCARQQHRRLTVSELRSLDQRLCAAGLRNSAYYVEKRPHKLGLSLMLVDRGSPVRRLIWKVKRLVGQRANRDGYRAWMLDQRFSITILTAFPAKQAQLVAAFAKTDRRLVPVRVALVPEFAPYLAQT